MKRLWTGVKNVAFMVAVMGIMTFGLLWLVAGWLVCIEVTSEFTNSVWLQGLSTVPWILSMLWLFGGEELC